ncbi:hypothetical protein [Streptomyces sp. CB00316]|uniref:hypothetical protein n=1 Tax=Streptomyces sp. CB00316 TaxID=1703932 RepID=UPI00093924D3
MWPDSSGGIGNSLAAPRSSAGGPARGRPPSWREAFNVKTVADLANLKYARWAQALAALDTGSS